MQIFTLVTVQIILISQTFCNSDDFDDLSEGDSSLYVLRAPNIIVCRRGFFVTIPHEPGLKNFEFHGNINSPIHYKMPGYLSQNVSSPVNGKWVYRNSVERLQIGDMISYWIYVTKDIYKYIKMGNYTVKRYNENCNNMHRFDMENDNSFPTDSRYPWLDFTSTSRPLRTTTRRIIPTTEKQYTVPTTQRRHTTKNPHTNPHSSSADEIRRNLEDCENQLFNISHTFNNAINERDHLKVINAIMERDIEKIIASNDVRILELGGPFPEQQEPQTWVHAVLYEKLKLNNVHNKIENGAFMSNEGSIIFKAKTYKDKLEILLAAQEHLKYSKISIKNP